MNAFGCANDRVSQGGCTHTHTHTQKGERKKPEKEEGGARGKQVEPF